MKRITEHFARGLMRLSERRAPDFLIGPKDDPYLRRWWLIPRNRWLNVYLHEIRHSDDDSALHDHPYWNMSVVLRGGYVEAVPGDAFKTRAPGSIVLRRASALHRLIVDEPAWSLFITGPRVREWGFACPQGWRSWTEFVKERDHGVVGRGCGEHAP